MLNDLERVILGIPKSEQIAIRKSLRALFVKGGGSPKAARKAVAAEWLKLEKRLSPPPKLKIDKRDNPYRLDPMGEDRTEWQGPNFNAQ